MLTLSYLEKFWFLQFFQDWIGSNLGPKSKCWFQDLPNLDQFCSRDTDICFLTTFERDLIHIECQQRNNVKSCTCDTASIQRSIRGAAAVNVRSRRAQKIRKSENKMQMLQEPDLSTEPLSTCLFLHILYSKFES